MSLNPDWMPEDDEDQKRKAAIEEMMRSNRARYFRDEPLQQEYRDILTRAADRSTEAAKPVRVAGPFDDALARFKERRAIAETRACVPDANDFPSVLDGGEAEAKSIFRRDSDVPDAPAETFPDSSSGKGDRLPISNPESRQSPSAIDPARYSVGTGRANGAAGLPVARQDDPTTAFEVDTPLRFDGEDRVEELQKNQPERPLPIKRSLKDQISYAAQKNGVGVEVHSGGQPPKALRLPRYQNRGPRHDNGDAADVDLYVIEDGKRRYLDLKNPKDQEIMHNFIRDAVIAGATGIGHGYMGTVTNGAITKTRRIHVGGGKPFAWGDQIKDRPDLNVPSPWVEAARQQGVATRDKLLKAGAWPNPTAPMKFMSGPDAALDFSDTATGDAITLSMMRDMIEKYMLAQGIRKDSSPK